MALIKVTRLLPLKLNGFQPVVNTTCHHRNRIFSKPNGLVLILKDLLAACPLESPVGTCIKDAGTANEAKNIRPNAIGKKPAIGPHIIRWPMKNSGPPNGYQGICCNPTANGGNRPEEIPMHWNPETETPFMVLAFELALKSEAEGNIPVGAVLTLNGHILAASGNRLLVPTYQPGGHAEMEVLRLVESQWWTQAADMTCYSTLEPCLMCFGALLLHGVGRVVFGSNDVFGGAGHMLQHLPPYYPQFQTPPHWIGPVWQAQCQPLYERAHARFIQLPCGGASS